MSRKRRRSWLESRGGTGFAQDRMTIGFLLSVGKAREALAAAEKALLKHKGRAQQYLLLCQAGRAKLAVGDTTGGEELFRSAIEAAYEPSGAEARAGLARCLLRKGDARGARDVIFTAIKYAGEAGRQDPVEGVDGVCILPPMPVCPSGIAMRIYSSFLRAGKAGGGKEILRQAILSTKIRPYRMTVLLGKLAEGNRDKKAAGRAFSQALETSKLGPRSLPALSGWCRISGIQEQGELVKLLQRYSSKMSSRAALAMSLALRGTANRRWQVPVFFDLPAESDPVASSELMLLRIAALRGQRRWEEIIKTSSALLSIPKIQAGEIKAAAAAACEASIAIGKPWSNSFVRTRTNREGASWAAHRAMMVMGAESTAAEFFRGARRKYGPRALSNLAMSLEMGGKVTEARKIYMTLLGRLKDPYRVRAAAARRLVRTYRKDPQLPPEVGSALEQFSQETTQTEVLADLAAGLAKSPPARLIADNIYRRARRQLQGEFNHIVNPRIAVRILGKMNNALRSFGGTGGVQRLYFSIGQGCMEWLSKGGPGFFRYSIEVYSDLISTDSVLDAAEMWKTVATAAKIPPKWACAKLVVEAEQAMLNRQARATELAAAAWSKYIIGEYAARACYILGLKELGEGKSPVTWAQRAITALGSRRLEAKNMLLVQKLDILAANVNRDKIPTTSFLARSEGTYKRTLGLLLSDLSRIESPLSS